MRTYAWRRLDTPGLEVATCRRRTDGAVLSGRVLLLDQDLALSVDYRIEVDARWVTRLVEVEQVTGGVPSALRLEHDGEGAWARNGRRDPGLDGCLDVDLGVTPLTNALPVNRLGLVEGGEAKIRAAWVRFPALSVDPAPQSYRRVGPTLYLYTGLGTGFTAQVEVDGDGFPIIYEGLWQRA